MMDTSSGTPMMHEYWPHSLWTMSANWNDTFVLFAVEREETCLPRVLCLRWCSRWFHGPPLFGSPPLLSAPSANNVHNMNCICMFITCIARRGAWWAHYLPWSVEVNAAETTLCDQYDPKSSHSSKAQISVLTHAENSNTDQGFWQWKTEAPPQGLKHNLFFSSKTTSGTLFSFCLLWLHREASTRMSAGSAYIVQCSFQNFSKKRRNTAENQKHHDRSTCPPVNCDWPSDSVIIQSSNTTQHCRGTATMDIKMRKRCFLFFYVECMSSLFLVFVCLNVGHFEAVTISRITQNIVFVHNATFLCNFKFATESRSIAYAFEFGGSHCILLRLTKSWSFIKNSRRKTSNRKSCAERQRIPTW